MRQSRNLIQTFFLCLIISAGVFGQTAQPNSQQLSLDENAITIQALLTEVRELRLTLERAMVNNNYAQITLERLRLQQQIVERATTRFENLRLQLSINKRNQTETTKAIKEFEDRLPQITEPTERKEIEQIIQRHKNTLEKLVSEEPELRQRETAAAAQLQAEQNKLTELNENFDAFQRKMERQMSIDKSQPSGKRPE